MTRGRVKPGAGLIQIHDQGVADETDGHAETPLHAARVFARQLLPSGGLRKIHAFQCFVDCSVEGGALQVLQASVEVAAQGQ